MCNSIGVNSNYGKAIYSDRNDYIKTISVGKEGKAEIEYRSLGRYKWAKVYLVLSVSPIFLYDLRIPISSYISHIIKRSFETVGKT